MATGISSPIAKKNYGVLIKQLARLGVVTNVTNGMVNEVKDLEKELINLKASSNTSL